MILTTPIVVSPDDWETIKATFMSLCNAADEDSVRETAEYAIERMEEIQQKALQAQAVKEDDPLTAEELAQRVADFIEYNKIDLSQVSMEEVVAAYFRCSLKAIEEAGKEATKFFMNL